MNLQAKLNVLTSSAVLFHYIYIHLDNYLTGAEFHRMWYHYLIQVSCLKQFIVLTKDIINQFYKWSHPEIYILVLLRLLRLEVGCLFM